MLLVGSQRRHVLRTDTGVHHGRVRAWVIRPTTPRRASADEHRVDLASVHEHSHRLRVKLGACASEGERASERRKHDRVMHVSMNSDTLAVAMFKLEHTMGHSHCEAAGGPVISQAANLPTCPGFMLASAATCRSRSSDNMPR